MDVVPGDKVKINVENMLRFAPLLAPLMHRVNITTHFYFVPNRILWPGWEDFITGESEDAPPFITNVNGLTAGSLGDYLGMPIGTTNTFNPSAFPIAAYAKIYDEYYRDQNLVTEVFSELVAGDTGNTNTSNYGALLSGNPLLRAFMHDYFTSCLPWPQKGDNVLLPLGTFDDVNVDLDIVGPPNAGMIVRDGNGDPLYDTGADIRLSVEDGDSTGTLVGWNTTVGHVQGFIDPNDNLIAKTSELEAQASDINTVRRAFRLQEFLERNARAGTRYFENILAHFGLRSPDSRLQRPEYIGGAKQVMTISEVLSTAETIEFDSNDALNPVGQMAGHGVSYGNGRKFSYRAQEHGWIMGIINVQPVTAYQQGLHRMYSRNDRLDYYWPSFANIGEQAVLNKEVYVDQAGTQDDTFGYVPRYAEYKYVNSRVAGEMATTLDFWHLGRKFSTAPALNQTFIECDPDDNDRIFAVQDGSHEIYAHVYNKIGAVRPMPKFGIPTI